MTQQYENYYDYFQAYVNQLDWLQTGCIYKLLQGILDRSHSHAVLVIEKTPNGWDVPYRVEYSEEYWKQRLPVSKNASHLDQANMSENVPKMVEEIVEEINSRLGEELDVLYSQLLSGNKIFASQTVDLDHVSSEGHVHRIVGCTACFRRADRNRDALSFILCINPVADIYTYFSKILSNLVNRWLGFDAYCTRLERMQTRDASERIDPATDETPDPMIRSFVEDGNLRDRSLSDIKSIVKLLPQSSEIASKNTRDLLNKFCLTHEKGDYVRGDARCRILHNKDLYNLNEEKTEKPRRLICRMLLYSLERFPREPTVSGSLRSDNSNAFEGDLKIVKDEYMTRKKAFISDIERGLYNYNRRTENAQKTRIDLRALLWYFLNLLYVSIRKDIMKADHEHFFKMRKHLSGLTVFLQGEFPPDAETIYSLIWVVSRYSHDHLKIEPRIDIGHHLWQAVRHEPSLHTLRRFYRDHFFHSLEVCFLGHKLLETEIGGRRVFDKLIRDFLPGESKESVLRQWYVASLLHDIGYGIDVFRGARDQLKFFRRSKKIESLERNTKDLIDELGKELLQGEGSELFRDFTEDMKPGEDHGVISAEHLRGVLAHIKKEKTVRDDYTPALRAIALHNCDRIPVNFRQDPLAFLLILCDTLQEWNRASFQYDMAPATLLSGMFGGGEPNQNGTRLLESVEMRTHEDKDAPALEFRLRFGPEINEDWKVFQLWLSATRNFQRLRIEALPIDIRIVFLTPRPPGSVGGDGKAGRQKLAPTSMDRLKQAAEETHMNFLYDWLPRERERVEFASDKDFRILLPDAPPEENIHDAKSNRAVTHIPQLSETGLKRYEVLVLDLKALSKKPLITGSIKEFHRLLSKWKHYNESRVFVGDYGMELPG